MENTPKTPQEVVADFNANMKDDPKGLFDLYKAYLSSADDVSKQRGNCNTFHISLNTAFFTVFGFVKGTAYEDYIPVFGSIFAICLSILWIVRINNFKKMNGVKFTLINEIEKRLAAQPYNYEWLLLQAKSKGSKYFEYSTLEKFIPVAFIIAYVMVIVMKLFFAK